MPKRALIIHQEPPRLSLLCGLLASAGYEPHVLPLRESTCRRVRALDPAAIVLDVPVHRPALALGIGDRLRDDARLCAVPRIVCCDFAFFEECACVQETTSIILFKPYLAEDLLALLAEALAATGQARGTPRASIQARAERA